MLKINHLDPSAYSSVARMHLCRVVIEDREGRRVAHPFPSRSRARPAIIGAAKKHGRVASAREVFSVFQQRGFRDKVWSGIRPTDRVVFVTNEAFVSA